MAWPHRVAPLGNWSAKVCRRVAVWCRVSYYPNMLPSPRFTSTRHQQLAVAAIMLGLLAVSITAAYTMTYTRARLPAVTRDAHVLGINLVLPARWHRITKNVWSGPESSQVKLRTSFVDPIRPSRQLTIIPAMLNCRPDAALRRAVATLVRLPPAVRLQSITDRPRAVHLATLVGLEYIGYARAQPAGPMKQYFVSVLTGDYGMYWVLMFTDTAPANKSIGGTIEQNIRIFDAILLSAHIGSGHNG